MKIYLGRYSFILIACLLVFTPLYVGTSKAYVAEDLPPSLNDLSTEEEIPIVETTESLPAEEKTVLSVETTETPIATEEENNIPATDLFPDLPVGSEYYVGVKYLKDKGLIEGYPDGLFRPKQHINRAEALKVLVGAINYNQYSKVERPLSTLESSPEIDINESCPFPDLINNSWYYEYVCKAYENKIIKGYPDGTFKPEQTINKVEAIKIVLLQSGISLQTDFTDNFDDVNAADWFSEYTRIANELTLMVEDRQGNLIPAEMLNRGDFCMLIYRTLKAKEANAEFGRATYYSGRFDGQGTASGESFSNKLPTAAHKTLPFNTIVKVTNLANGKSVEVRINDRGPYVNGTIIDLSNTAFSEIASLSTGVIHSEVEIVETPAT